MVLKTKKKATREPSEQKKQSLKDVSSGNMKRLNANVPESTHKALKTKAADNGTTINELILKWVNEYLSK